MLIDQISLDMKQALLQKESLRLSVLRMLWSELNYKKIDLQRDLTDEDVIGVIRREVKKRDEAIEAYTKADRQDQLNQEKQEKLILEVYLPKLMDEEEIRQELSDSKLLEGIREFGQAMKLVSPLFKGRAEGSLVAKIVKEWITK